MIDIQKVIKTLVAERNRQYSMAKLQEENTLKLGHYDVANDIQAAISILVDIANTTPLYRDLA